MVEPHLATEALGFSEIVEKEVGAFFELDLETQRLFLRIAPLMRWLKNQIIAIEFEKLPPLGELLYQIWKNFFILTRLNRKNFLRQGLKLAPKRGAQVGSWKILGPVTAKILTPDLVHIF